MLPPDDVTFAKPLVAQQTPPPVAPLEVRRVSAPWQACCTSDRASGHSESASESVSTYRFASTRTRYFFASAMTRYVAKTRYILDRFSSHGHVSDYCGIPWLRQRWLRRCCR